MTVNTRSGAVTIKAADVLALLKKGYTRFEKDNKGYGSIQTQYGLTESAVRKLFQAASLKNKKTITPKFILEEGEKAEAENSIPSVDKVEENIFA